MEKYQIDQLDMLYAVENHFDDNPTPWAGKVPIEDTLDLLKTKIGEIGAQYAVQLLNTTGVTKAKSAVRLALEEIAYTVSSALTAFAGVSGNDELYDKSYIPESSYTLFKDAELLGNCVNIKILAENNVLDLGAFEIDATVLSNFGNLITDFSNINKNPTEAIAIRKKATDKIAELLPEGIDLLTRRMDHLMVGLKATQPDFVAVYFNVRNVVNTGAQVRSLTTLCLDSVTLAPLQEVTLNIVSLNQERVSPASGFNVFQNVAAGSYELSASRGGYVTQTIPFVVVANITTELAISLVKE